MFWQKRLPEINVRLIGVGHKFFYSPEEHAHNPALTDGNHYVKFDTNQDAYFAYCILDSNQIIKYYRHSVGTYYSVDRRSFSVGDIKRSDWKLQEEYRFLQIGDDWAYIIGKENPLDDATIVDVETFDLVIADEAALRTLQEAWKKEND